MIDFLVKGERAVKTAKYQPNVNSQLLLYEINKSLRHLERKVIRKLDDFSHVPILFISYIPRSGSTLLSQLLIQTKSFNYISNFQSRFWLAPYLGSVLERTLLDKFKCEVSLGSDYGLTSEPYEPSEFTYFWEHWLKLSSKPIHTLSSKDYKRLEGSPFLQEMNAIRSTANYPLLFKKEWLGMNAGFLLERVPNCKFIHIDRNPFDLAASILKARVDVLGSINKWWAAKPSNYLDLIGIDPYKQVAGQIWGIKQDINKWVKRYPDKFFLTQFESLIENPRKQITLVTEFMGLKIPARQIQNVPAKLKKKGDRTDIQFSEKKIRKALKEFGIYG